MKTQTPRAHHTTRPPDLRAPGSLAAGLLAAALCLLVTATPFSRAADPKTTRTATPVAPSTASKIQQSAPAITKQPANVTVTIGKSATFSVTASGAPAPSYQWQSATRNGNIWTDETDSPYGIAGSRTAQLKVPPAELNQSGMRYRCVVTNTAGSVTSNEATLTVASPPAASIGMPGSSQGTKANTGSDAILVATTSGNPTPSCQWQVSTNNGSTYGNVPNTSPYSGGNTPKLVISSVPFSFDGYKYRCAVTNNAGSAYSNIITLTVIPPANSITRHPASITVAGGKSATFTVAVNGVTNPAYQWQRKPATSSTWTNLANTTGISAATPMNTIRGATTNQLVIDNVVPLSTTDNQYRCVIKGAGGITLESNAATLTITAPPPIITKLELNPKPGTIKLNDNVTITIEAASPTTPITSYQWQTPTPSGWVNVTDSSTIKGAKTAKLEIPKISAPGNYRCLVTNSAGTTTSDHVSVSYSITSSSGSSGGSTTAAATTGKMTSTFTHTAPNTPLWSQNGWTSMTALPAGAKITSIKNTGKTAIILSRLTGGATKSGFTTLAVGASTNNFSGLAGSIQWFCDGPYGTNPPEGAPSIEVTWTK